MELIREYIPTGDAQKFTDLPMNEQVIALRNLAAAKIAETLDPIQQAQQDLLNGIV
jgi:hypothetical protein